MRASRLVGTYRTWLSGDESLLKKFRLTRSGKAAGIRVGDYIKKKAVLAFSGVCRVSTTLVHVAMVPTAQSDREGT